jgi:hypothetical protein
MTRLRWIRDNVHAGEYLLGVVVHEGVDKRGKAYHIGRIIDTDQQVFCPEKPNELKVNGVTIVVYRTRLEQPRGGKYPVAKQDSGDLLVVKSMFEEGPSSYFWRSIGGEPWLLVKASDLESDVYRRHYEFTPGNKPTDRYWVLYEDKAIRGTLEIVVPLDADGDPKVGEYNDPWSLHPKGEDW